MENDILFSGIETNNLKNISIVLKKNAINLIIGPSGSGKSSLAYDTVAQIGIHEYLSLFDDKLGNPLYKINSYNNIIPTVPLQQKNTNNNIQSTIGSYFGINSKIIALFCIKNGIKPNQFSLHNSDNVCDLCHGIGYINSIDINKVVDFKKKVKEVPFRCWYRYFDFYEKILIKFCQSEGIDVNCVFSSLSSKDKEKLLYGESSNKFSVQYKHGKNKSSRTTKYFGVMLNKPMRKPNYKIPDSYYGRVLCPRCKGKKYSQKFEKIKIDNESIGSLLVSSFHNIKLFLDRQNEISEDKEYKTIVSDVLKFVNKCIELNLGHLSFNRAIPTLSGGELQRLRLVQLFVSRLHNLLVVLDEPLAGLSGQERQTVLDNIILLSKKHTLLIVDHSDSLLKIASNIITLGPKSGDKGGELVDTSMFIEKENRYDLFPKIKNSQNKIEYVEVNTDILGYKGIKISIVNKGLNIISGRSGIGKTTLLREYLPIYFDSYEYISQKYISSNNNSNVATLLSVAEPIFRLFGKHFNKTSSFFSNNSTKEGACQNCNGAGFIIENGVMLKCDKCQGTGFDIDLRKYQINGKSIIDIWLMTLDELSVFFENIDLKLANEIKFSDKLFLGHLFLGQQTSTLSGGENMRSKLFRLSKSRASVIALDEPFRGLGKSEISEICLYFEQLTQKGKTIIVADHDEFAFRYFHKHIKLNQYNDYLIGD